MSNHNNNNNNRPESPISPILRLIPEQIKVFVLLFFAVVLIVFVGWFGGWFGGWVTNAIEALGKNIKQDPYSWAVLVLAIVFGLILSIILTIILTAIGMWYRWKMKVPGVLEEVEAWFDPHGEKSRIKFLVDRINRPDQSDTSLFYEVLGKGEKSLPKAIEKVQEGLDQLRKVSQSYVSFLEWGEQWKEIANRAIDTLARESIRDLILLKPDEYIKFIENSDKRYQKQNNTKSHIRSITLFGTMIGFSFLLPEAICNHAFSYPDYFGTLRLIASDAYLDTKPLVHYPLYLTYQIIELLLSCNKIEEKILEKKEEITIEIIYVPHDLFNAAIFIENSNLVLLQALDSKSFSDILYGARSQAGFISEYSKTDYSRTKEYERYKNAINNIRQYYQQERKFERWKLLKDSNSDKIALEISNPHWIYQNHEMNRILPSQKDYDNEDESQQKIIGDEDIEKFLGSCARTILSGDTGQDIKILEDLAKQRIATKTPSVT